MTTGSMVERVARAIRQYDGLSVSAQMASSTKVEAVQAHVVGSSGTCLFGPATILECQAWINQKKGRAAIEAMREPTRAMTTGAFKSCGGWSEDASPEVWWQAMIDAALKDGHDTKAGA